MRGYKNNKRNLSAVLLMCILASVCLMLGSCGARKNFPDTENQARELIDAIISNDSATAYEYLREVSDSEDFGESFEQMHNMLKDTGRYKLKLAQYTEISSEGTYSLSAFYLMYSKGKVYQIRVKVVDGYSGFASFYIVELFGENSENMAGVGSRIGFWIFALLCVAICVLMIVDCVKRDIKGKNPKLIKAILILLMLVGVTAEYTFGSGGANLRILPGSVFQMSDAFVDMNIARVTVFLPIGAIVYFILRKKLTKAKESPWGIDTEGQPQIEDNMEQNNNVEEE